MTVTIVIVLSTLVVVGIGLAWRNGTGYVRMGNGERIEPHDVRVAGEDFGEEATLLLFTSQQDPMSEPVRTILRKLALQNSGVRVAEVDLTAEGDLAGRYAITRTPSVLGLDKQHRIRAWTKGPADLAVLSEILRRCQS